ncbi:hypothetical protein GOBAR_DD17988 [Gossypium barbadense]|nr:hypothetical protein GOBAR_DD17988 [Gossypium barbadense]
MSTAGHQTKDCVPRLDALGTSRWDDGSDDAARRPYNVAGGTTGWAKSARAHRNPQIQVQRNGQRRTAAGPFKCRSECRRGERTDSTLGPLSRVADVSGVNTARTMRSLERSVSGSKEGMK